MSPTRRDFLKGAAALGLAASLTVSPGCFRDDFDHLWDLMKDFNETRNERLVGRATLDEQKEAWKEVRQYAGNHFPEADLDGKTKDDFYTQMSFFQDHGKVYYKTTNLADPSIDTITLGKIAGWDDLPKTWRESFDYDGATLDYNVVLFEQEGRTIDDLNRTSGRASWFEKTNNSVYINLTKLKRSARKMYEQGSEIKSQEGLDFKQSMLKELYDAVLDEAEEKHPLQTRFGLTYRAFENEFVKAVIRTSINHERMHYFFPYPEDPEKAKKAVRDERETFLYEVAQDPKFNSSVFLLTCSSYENFYRAFQDAGYSLEDIADIKPEQRSAAADSILNKL